MKPETIAIICAVVSLAFNCVQQFLLQRKSIALAEYNILRETCDRLRSEKDSLNQEVGKLKERTDLKPLMDEILDWRKEGRLRFEAATEQLKANTEAVVALTKIIMQQVNTPNS